MNLLEGCGVKHRAGTLQRHRQEIFGSCAAVPAATFVASCRCVPHRCRLLHVAEGGRFEEPHYIQPHKCQCGLIWPYFIN
jgi:hypothetical protein